MNTKFDEIIVYENVTLAQLFKEVRENSVDKGKKLKKLVDTLSNLITDNSSATLIGPLVAEYMDTAIKNDDQLLKLAAIVQRSAKEEASSEKGIGSLLSDDERADLIKSHKETKIISMDQKVK